MSTLPIDSSALRSVLVELIERYNITEAELARAINLPRATINRIKSGKIIDPRSSTLTLIAHYFNISIDQLLGHVPLSYYNQPTANIVRVPLLEWEQVLSAKVKGEAINSINHETWIHFECEKNNRPQSLFALKIKGEAMWPYFDDKSIILVDPQIDAQNRSFIVVYITNTEEVILRQLLIDGKSKILNPLNSAFAPITLSTTDQIIGVVAHVKKSF